MGSDKNLQRSKINSVDMDEEKRPIKGGGGSFSARNINQMSKHSKATTIDSVEDYDNKPIQSKFIKGYLAESEDTRKKKNFSSEIQKIQIETNTKTVPKQSPNPKIGSMEGAISPTTYHSARISRAILSSSNLLKLQQSSPKKHVSHPNSARTTPSASKIGSRISQKNQTQDEDSEYIEYTEEDEAENENLNKMMKSSAKTMSRTFSGSKFQDTAPVSQRKEKFNKNDLKLNLEILSSNSETPKKKLQPHEVSSSTLFFENAEFSEEENEESNTNSKIISLQNSKTTNSNKERQITKDNNSQSGSKVFQKKNDSFDKFESEILTALEDQENLIHSGIPKNNQIHPENASSIFARLDERIRKKKERLQIELNNRKSILSPSVKQPQEELEIEIETSEDDKRSQNSNSNSSEEKIEKEMLFKTLEENKDTKFQILKLLDENKSLKLENSNLKNKISSIRKDTEKELTEKFDKASQDSQREERFMKKILEENQNLKQKFELLMETKQLLQEKSNYFGVQSPQSAQNLENLQDFESLEVQKQEIEKIKANYQTEIQSLQQFKKDIKQKFEQQKSKMVEKETFANSLLQENQILKEKYQQELQNSLQIKSELEQKTQELEKLSKNLEEHEKDKKEKEENSISKEENVKILKEKEKTIKKDFQTVYEKEIEKIVEQASECIKKQSDDYQKNLLGLKEKNSSEKNEFLQKIQVLEEENQKLKQIPEQIDDERSDYLIKNEKTFMDLISTTKKSLETQQQEIQDSQTQLEEKDKEISILKKKLKEKSQIKEESKSNSSVVEEKDAEIQKLSSRLQYFDKKNKEYVENYQKMIEVLKILEKEKKFLLLQQKQQQSKKEEEEEFEESDSKILKKNETNPLLQQQDDNVVAEKSEGLIRKKKSKVLTPKTKKSVKFEN